MKAEGLTIEDQMEIIRAGGQFEETGPTSWVGILVRKGDKEGRVVKDLNGLYRDLRVRFEDGSEEIISLNNLGEDHPYVHEYEWCNGEWHRF